MIIRGKFGRSHVKSMHVTCNPTSLPATTAAEKNKMFMSVSEEQGTPYHPLYVWNHGPLELVDHVAQMFGT